MGKLNRLCKRMLSLLVSILLIIYLVVPMGVSEMKARAETDGLNLSKSYDATTGLLTIEAYVTGATVTTTVTEYKPSDVILVLDQSGSMIYKDDGYSADTRMDDGNGGLISRIDALKNAVSSFLGYVKTSDKDIRVSAVGFSDGINATDKTKNYINTELFNFTASGVTRTAYPDIIDPAATAYANAFVEQDYFTADNIIRFKDAMITQKTTWNTYHDLGLQMALNIMNARTAQQKAERDCIVVMFTDGEPFKDSDYGTSKNKTAMETINIAKQIKDAGGKLYTIGIFNDADAKYDIGYNYSGTSTLSGSTMINGFNKNSTTTTKYARNLFMHLVSSNYPGASMALTGTSSFSVTPGDEKAKTYYLTADNAVKLNDAFTGIAKTVTTGGAVVNELTSSTVLRDVISDSFKYDTGGQKSIRIYKQNYIGENEWDDPVEVTDDPNIHVEYNEETKTFDITGFDYSANWVGTDTRDGVKKYVGTKLVATIPITCEEGADGATNIRTNGAGSGVVPPGQEETIEELPFPTTDIPTDITVTKRFAGNYIKDTETFSLTASVSDHIIGFEEPDAKNYSKSITKPLDYDPFLLGKDETYSEIKDILVASEGRDSTVTITEEDVPVGYTVTISDGKTEETFYADGGDISKTFSVYSGMAITVTNNRVLPPAAGVTVKNEVAGNMGDKLQLFGVTGSYKSGNADKPFSNTLLHGGAFTKDNVDLSSVFTFRQTNSEGYITVVTVNGEVLAPVNGQYSFTVTEDTTVIISNTRDVNADVGVVLDYLPYVLIILFVILGVVLLLIRKRRGRPDDS